MATAQSSRAYGKSARPEARTYCQWYDDCICTPHCYQALKVEVPELKLRPPSNSPTVASTSLSLPSRPGFIQCYNPSTLSFLGEVPVTSPESVVAAVKLARSAQKSWAATSWQERRRVLRTMAAAVRAHTDDILLLSAIDTGKQRG